MDSRFRVEVLGRTERPQQLVWAALHQDYSAGLVADSRDNFPDEAEAGQRILTHLLKGDRGHFGPLEHPSITFNVGGFPHSVMQQLRTHRVGVSFDVQSFRYTGQHVVDAVRKAVHSPMSSGTDRSWVEELIYFRPVGKYTNRGGKRYEYSASERDRDIQDAASFLYRYEEKFSQYGFSEEHARSMLPFDYRQHFVLTCNTRSLMHLLDMRSKADAQLEIQQLCELLMGEFERWMPEIAGWYRDRRYGKARLSP